MTGRAGTKGVPREERERQILDEAAAEFGTHGYAHASVAEIANRAGISKPLVYSYFESKDGLFLACLHRAGPPLVQAVAAAQHPVPGRQRAADTLAAIFTTLEPRPHDWSIVYDPTVPAGSPIEQQARKYRRALNRLGAVGVSEVLADVGGYDAKDESLLTQVWFGVVTAMVRWWQQHPAQTASDMIARSQRVIAAL
ncbi:hypothetical protein GCM10010174_00370 [Kutzneria viridogrisea]|uniref:HTH tetR-type domain-containing protein n=2 Tax=Kutzneria TaxID=43356 RepID=W5WBE2_9PSEU|nr:TetR/AcrR family transcriptional regulator [Kutzneria albida]AHH97851.1 hypothetical protein KALB_4489 [Kutzneria albida DSM 43870]MBA8924555.1 AcrR family transcriptional regulator [Kutzneria viridogrisea]